MQDLIRHQEIICIEKLDPFSGCMMKTSVARECRPRDGFMEDSNTVLCIRQWAGWKLSVANQYDLSMIKLGFGRLQGLFEEMKLICIRNDNRNQLLPDLL